MHHCFGICLTCAESWNLTLSDILLVVSINGSGVLLSPQQNPTIAFFTNLWWTINYIIPFFFFLIFAQNWKKKYKPYILVTVSLQFLHVDIVILYCNSERSATPTEFAIMILMPFRIPFYVTFWFIYSRLYSKAFPWRII